MRPVTVLPSLLSCDFAKIGEEMAFCKRSGARSLHIDVMDGHFVPNLTLGPPLVAAMRAATDLELDVHLMMTNPLDYIDAFRAAGSDRIYVHVEAIGPRSIDAAIAAIRATGAEVGLAFNPDTDPAMWHGALAQVDAAMIMTVYPGFGGQSFIEATRPRIRALRAAFPDLPIQVDGGVNRDTVAMVTADGADRLVAGNAFFKDADPAAFLAFAEGHKAN
ncbi:MAG: ribulose-phosphate 3-epimerase [Planctomycetota bacterium]|jgi:ribulose-phosphate 3-epimerase|nr:ribulose-phosphate 3-epimerase [Planctomycetota bacterium]